MMMIVLRLLSLLLPLLGLKSRWHRHFGPRPLNEVFFQGGKSLNSWTPGPKPLWHRHPTGPHPRRLWWTPAKGSSTKSNVALGCWKLEIERRGPDRHRQRIAGGKVRRQAGAVGLALERQHQAAAHAEHGVLLEVLVVVGEELGDQRRPARRFDDHVQVRRPPGMSAQHAQHVARRA